MTSSTKSHNLDIKMYSFKELLGLFHLSYDFNESDLKRAKHQTLHTHPDKSGLSAEYFHFYSQAYSMVLNYYIETQKTNKTVPHTNLEYSPLTQEEATAISNKKQIKSSIKKMKPEDFNATFNRLFDQNMAKPPDPLKNAWFSSESPEYEIPDNVTQQSISHQIDKIKKRANAMIPYKDFSELTCGGGGASKLYDQNPETNTDDDYEYRTSDPFSKLKYDDLRKVHKDQTVLAVSESDLSKIRQYESSEHLMRERSAQSIIPIDKQAAEAILQMREKENKERMLAKEHTATLETMKYAEKNKAVVASFLQIKY